MSKKRKGSPKLFLALLGVVALAVLVALIVSPSSETYGELAGEAVTAEDKADIIPPKPPEKPQVPHLPTPESVKALYITSWVAGTPHLRENILNLVRTTEANALVVDIKDDTGRISFKVEDLDLQAIGAEEVRIADMRELFKQLHEEGVYMIGRIASFQDPYLVGQKPEWAVRSAATGGVWKDRKGLTWLDASQKEVWDYLVSIGLESWEAGFDELNYDYIRFPTDGNLDDIVYAVSGDRVNESVVVETRIEKVYAEDGVTVLETRDVPVKWVSGKSEIIREFFEYLTAEIREKARPTKDGQLPAISADLFGLVTVAADDLGIGQWLEFALPYFDYVAPMTYPSHYADGWNGFANPADHPYEVLKISMDRAVERTKAMGEDPDKLRPWLQDFNLGATYTADKVRAQIEATYDAGLDSWMIWDAANTYTPGSLLPE